MHVVEKSLGKDLMSRLYMVFTCLTVAIVGLLVLLRTDGLSFRVVLAAGFATLGVTAVTFRSAVQTQGVKPGARKVFEWCGGLSFLALLIAYFVFDSAK